MENNDSNNFNDFNEYRWEVKQYQAIEKEKHSKVRYAKFFTVGVIAAGVGLKVGLENFSPVSFTGAVLAIASISAYAPIISAFYHKNDTELDKLKMERNLVNSYDKLTPEHKAAIESPETVIGDLELIYGTTSKFLKQANPIEKLRTQYQAAGPKKLKL